MKPGARKMMYNNIEYESIADAFSAAKLDNKDMERVRTYLKRHKESYNYDLSYILELIDYNRRGKGRTIFGVYYKNQTDIAKQYKLGISTIRKIKRDCDLEKYILDNVYILNGETFRTFAEFCNFMNINANAYGNYLHRSGLDTKPLNALNNVENYIKASKSYSERHTIKEARENLCEKLGISFYVVNTLAREQSKTFEEALNIVKKQKNEGIMRVRLSNEQVDKYKSLVKQAGLKDYHAIVNYANTNNISIEERICLLNPNCSINENGELVIPPKDEWTTSSRAIITDKDAKLIKMCGKLGIKKNRALKIRREHPELTNVQIIDIINTRDARIKYKMLRELCGKAKIDAQRAVNYKSIHPELTDEQVILYYRPDCYINIIGELVMPE